MDVSFAQHTGMPTQFKFPIRSVQLCDQPTEHNVFYVQDRIDVGRWKESNLLEQLEKIIDSIGGERNKCLKILTNEVFDPIYSILFHMEDVSITIRKEVLQLLVQGLKNLISLIERTKILDWASQNFLSNSTIEQLVRDDPQCKLAIQI